jgi:hypothetical protein
VDGFMPRFGSLTSQIPSKCHKFFKGKSSGRPQILLHGAANGLLGSQLLKQLGSHGVCSVSWKSAFLLTLVDHFKFLSGKVGEEYPLFLTFFVTEKNLKLLQHF